MNGIKNSARKRTSLAIKQQARDRYLGQDLHRRDASRADQKLNLLLLIINLPGYG
jgi:hypothetical protein